MELESYAIVSPVLGQKLDMPSILLNEAYLSDSKDVFFKDGEIHRLRKRRKLFEHQLPDSILKLDEYEKPSINSKKPMILTRRDICWYDSVSDKLVFINPIYNEGTIIGVEELSGGRFRLEFSLPTGEDLTDSVKADDFIQIEDNTSYHSGVTWYEIEDVDDATHITCIGSLPTGFEIPTGGQDYAIRKTYAGTDTDIWSTETINEIWFATNGMDLIQEWNGENQAGDYEECPYKARFITKFENRVIIGNLTVIDGGAEMPFAFGWSGLGFAGMYDWGQLTGSDSGIYQVDTGQGRLVGAGEAGPFLVFLKEKSIVKYWAVATEAIFERTLVIDGLGTIARESIIKCPKGLAFHGSDNTFRIYDGNSLSIISGNIAPLIGEINPAYGWNIRGTWSKQYNQLLWAIPYSTSEINNKLLIYNVDKEYDNWGVGDFNISCFGRYMETEDYTWDTLPFDTWDTWAWDSWNQSFGTVDNYLDIVGSVDGYVYVALNSELDDDETYEGYAVLETDLGEKSMLGLNKRILQIEIIARQEVTGDLSIDIKRDNESTWQPAGSISLTDTGDKDIIRKKIPVDFLGKSFKVKPKGENAWRLIGLIFYYSKGGRR